MHPRHHNYIIITHIEFIQCAIRVHILLPAYACVLEFHCERSVANANCRIQNTAIDTYIWCLMPLAHLFPFLRSFLSLSPSLSLSVSSFVFFLVWFLKHVKVLPKPEQPERKLTRARECVSHYTLLNIHSSRPIPVFIKVKFMRV